VDEFVQKKKGKGIISKTAAIILHQSIRAKNLKIKKVIYFQGGFQMEELDMVQCSLQILVK